MTITRDSIVAAVNAPFRPLWNVTAHHDSFGVVDLPTTRSQLTFDEQNAPYAELRLDAPAPGSDLDRLLDPRTGVRVHVHAGYFIGGRRDTQLIADLGLRDRSSQSPEGSAELNAASDEALVIDCAPARQLTTRTSTSHVAMIQSLLYDVFGYYPPQVYTLGSVGAALSWPAGTLDDRWDAIEQVADQLGDVWVYCDEYRRWNIVPRPTLATVPELRFADPDPELVSAPVLSSSSTQTRSTWANRVFLRYRWDDAGTEHTIDAIQSVTSGPFAATAPNIRTHTESRSVPVTQAQADAAAASLVRRLASRGRLFTFRAPALWWLRPGATIAFRGRRALVSRVMFDSAGWMEVATRYPDPLNTTIG